MNKKRALTFSITRTVAAIFIAILVATLLIFVSSKGNTVGAKFSETLVALRAMLIGPLFRNNGSFNTKGFLEILALMVPIMLTGLATVMFSANQFNLGLVELCLAFITALIAIYTPLPPVILL